MHEAGTIMGTIVLDYEQARDEHRRIIGWLEGGVLAGAGILLPMLCFAASLQRYPGAPDYQRGEWLDYLILVPSVPASWPFAPLLFAAACAMAVAVVAPHRVAQSRLLRGALYSGAILSAQYTFIQAMAVVEPRAMLSIGTVVAVIISAIATSLALGVLWLLARVPRIKPVYGLVVLILIPVAVVAGRQIAIAVVLLGAMLVALIAPALTLAVFLRTSFIIGKLAQQEPHEKAGTKLGVPIAWLLTYGTMCAIAFMNAVELYNSLPKTPPDC